MFSIACRWRFFAVTLVGATFLAQATIANGAPTIKDISIRGLQIGGKTTITIKGSELLPRPRLFVPFPLDVQTVHQGATSESVTLDVSLPRSVAPDIYPIRLVTDQGVSNALLVGVDSLRQVPLAAEAKMLPVAMHGMLSGDQIHRVTFHAKKDQQIVVDVEGKRLGGNLRPVVRITDSEGRQLIRAQRARSIQGDARVRLKIPSDGQYRIELHDQVYKSPSPGYFRLKIGELQYADFVHPLAASSNHDLQIQFASSNIEDRQWIRNRESVSGWIRAGWPSGGNKKYFTGAQPLLFVSQGRLPTFVETSQPMQVTVPATVHGCLKEQDEADDFEVSVTPGKKLRIEVHSHRLGTPLDSVLTVSDASGKELAKNDDHQNSLDPGLDFVVPEKTTKIKIQVSSLAGHAGPDCIYRLTAREDNKQSFTIRAPSDRILVNAGGRTIIPLEIDRQGYNDELAIQLGSGSGPLIRSNSTSVFPGADKCLVSITSPSYTQAVLPLRFEGRSKDGAITKFAKVPTIPGLRDNSPRQHEVVAAVFSHWPLTRVDWTEIVPQEMILGGRHQAKIRFAEQTDAKVRLTLMTSQRMPTKKEKNKQVDDLARAIRMHEKNPVLEKDQADSTIDLVVPNDLPQRKWTLAVKAEFLSEDGKRVTNVAYTEPVAIPAVLGLGIELKSDAKRKLTIGHQDAVAFYGKITRHKDLKYPVRVALSGLPKELGTPQVVMAADQREFALSVPVGQINDAKKLQNLNLTAVFDGKIDQNYRDIRSNNIGLEIELVKKDK